MGLKCFTNFGRPDRLPLTQSREPANFRWDGSTDFVFEEKDPVQSADGSIGGNSECACEPVE